MTSACHVGKSRSMLTYSCWRRVYLSAPTVGQNLVCPLHYRWVQLGRVESILETFEGDVHYRILPQTCNRLSLDPLSVWVYVLESSWRLNVSNDWIFNSLNLFLCLMMLFVKSISRVLVQFANKQAFYPVARPLLYHREWLFRHRQPLWVEIWLLTVFGSQINGRQLCWN